MATGLEALGAASAVISLISFAGSLASLTMKIYDGIPTAENALEDYATRMLDAAKRVKSRQVPRGTPINDKLSEVSQRTIDAAGELEKATRNITAQRGNRLQALYSAVRAKKKRAKINELNKSLNMCKEFMETELLMKICDQNTAIAQQQSRRFEGLDSDVRNLILQLAAGHTRVEQILSTQTQATQNAINSNTAELRAFAAKNISDDQRQRLLRSLKSEEIRERYNSVLPSSDACFERVFASFERVCRNDPGYKAWNPHGQDFNDGSDNESDNSMFEEESKESGWVDEIDHLWECFSTWLQSDDKLFWIRGKPGSGKSTLIKRRYQGQSIEEFKCSQAKDFYKEWSSQEAEEILFSILDTAAHSTCIFIDGLDEISDRDGYQIILNVVQRLMSCQRLKVCVSSRPETELVRRLERIGSQNLRLDDLTKPEMAIYLQKEFEKVPKEQSADLPLEKFKGKLLDKAQGVFLWLALASKSVTTGIMNGDDQETLSQRLEQLPEELESLYQTMWERLNGNSRVYRQIAARYFRFVIEDSWGAALRWKDELFFENSKVPNLDQLSLAVKVEDGLIFPPKLNEIKLSKLKTLCAATENDIQTRCAGILQVGRDSVLGDKNFPDAIYPLMRPVQFIHRTAHDFLVDTEYGQSILNYRSNETTLLNEELKLLKCRLHLANTYYRELEVVSDGHNAAAHCNRLNYKGTNPEVILAILGTIKDLYEDGALDDVYSLKNHTQSFPCFAAYHLTRFDDFIISSFMPTPSPELATDSLRELALADGCTGVPGTIVRIIRRMVELGGEAHAFRKSYISFKFPGHKMLIAQHTTALELFLCATLNPNRWNSRSFQRNLLDVIDSLVQTCPDLHRRVVLFLGEHGLLLFDQLREVELWVALEVDLQFFINRLLANADLENMPTEFNYRICELAVSFTKPHARFRHLVRRRGEDPRTYCCRILDQEPCQHIIESLGDSEKYYEAIRALGGVLDSMTNPIQSSTHVESSFPSGCFKEVPIEEEMDMLIQEGIGLYRVEVVNIGYQHSLCYADG